MPQLNSIITINRGVKNEPLLLMVAVAHKIRMVSPAILRLILMLRRNLTMSSVALNDDKVTRTGQVSNKEMIVVISIQFNNSNGKIKIIEMLDLWIGRNKYVIYY